MAKIVHNYNGWTNIKNAHVRMQHVLAQCTYS